MGNPGLTSTVLHLPGEVALMLRCSEWWLKDQARKRRIPHCRIGGGYQFTDEHVLEIVRLFEVRPDETPEVATVSAPRRSVGRSSSEDGHAPVIQLRARTPRRTRLATKQQAA